MRRYTTAILYLMFILISSVAFISIAGIRVGLLAPLTGFLMIRMTVLAAIAFCLVSVVFCLLNRYVLNRGKNGKKASSIFYLICIVTSLIYSASWLTFHYQKKQLPLLNDIVTNVDEPLMFIRIGDVRHTDDNSIKYSDTFPTIQQTYYPNIQPLVLTQSAETVFQQVVTLVQSNGWEVVSLYPKERVIEATVTTPVFWFIDDVIIQVKVLDGNSVVDMRSSSRIGQGDYGTNAQRVKTFLAELSLMNEEVSIPLDESVY